MRKSRFSEHRIIKILKEAECGRPVKEVCHEYEVSSATYYKWESKHGGMEASDIGKLKDPEGENRPLKQMFAGLILKNRALKGVIERKRKAGGAARPG